MPRKPQGAETSGVANKHWRIFLAPPGKGVSNYLGVVEAPDADAAITVGAERFGYDGPRLIAQPFE